MESDRNREGKVKVTFQIWKWEKIELLIMELYRFPSSHFFLGTTPLSGRP